MNAGRPHYVLFFTLLFCFLFNELNCLAQNGNLIQRQPYLINHTTADGLPSNTIYQCITDSLGRLFLATGQGVSVYDGKSFINYSTANGLKGNIIFGFHRDFSGRLWYYSFEGKIGFWDNGHWHSVKGNEELSKKYTGSVIGSMNVYEDESILIGYKEKAFSGVIKLYSDGSFSEEINSQDKKGAIIYQLNSDSIVWTHGEGPYSELKLNDTTISMDAPDLWGSILLFSNGKRFLAHNNKAFEITKKGLLQIHSSDESIVHDVYHDTTTNSQWVSTRDNGVFEVNDGRVLNHFLKGVSVYYTYKDLEGGLWFSTAEKGLFYWPPDRPQYFPFSDMKYNRIVCKKQDEIVLANNNQVSTWQMKKTEMQKSKQLYFDRVKNVACRSNLILVSDGYKTKIFDSNLTLIQSHVEQDFYCIDQHDQQLILGSTQLNYIDGITGKNIKKKLPQIQRIITLKQDEDKVIVGSMNGLFVFQDTTLKYVHESDGRIQKIIKWENGYLILIDGKGVSYWNGRLGEESIWEKDVSQSLFIRKAFALKDKVLLLTNEGYEFLKLEGGSWKSQCLPKALIHYQRYTDAFYDGDYLWLLCSTGIFPVQLNEQTTSKSSDLKLIVQLQVENKFISFHEFPRSFDADQNDVIVKLQTPSFYHLPFISYQYSINNDTWRTVKGDEFQLASLSPDDYLIGIRVLLNGEAIGLDKSVRFKILPPFWKRTWFIMVVFIALLSIAFAIGFYLNRKRQQFLQEELLRQKAQLNAIQSQINPHFLFNVFNSIQQLVLNHQAKEAIRGMSKFSRLMRSALNVSKHEFISVKREIEFLELYVELENLRLEEKVMIFFSMENNIDEETVLIPPMILQILIENAIWHGLQERKTEKKINIHFRRVDQFLITTIRDNGIGVKQSKEKRAQFGKQHSSKGMGLIKEKLKILEQLYHQPGMEIDYKEVDFSSKFPGTIVKLKTVYREEY